MQKRNQNIQILTLRILNLIRNKIQNDQKNAMLNYIRPSKQHSQPEEPRITDPITKNKGTDQIYTSGFKGDNIFDEVYNILDKLKKLKRRMNTLDKFQKQKLNLFNGVLDDFSKELEQILDERSSPSVRVDKQVSLLIDDTNKALTEGDRILTSLEKQTVPICWGRTSQTKYTFYRAIINITSFAHVWSIIFRFTPIIQEKVQKVEVPVPILHSLNQIQNQIREEIQTYLPIIQETQACQRVHLSSHHASQSFSSSVSSMTENSHRQLELPEQPPQGQYMKIEQINSLKQQLEIQSTLRVAHEKLFGFCRPQDFHQAVILYKKIVGLKRTPKTALAYNAMGELYEKGSVVERNLKKAIEMFGISAQQGDSQGLYRMGKFCEKGLIAVSSGRFSQANKFNNYKMQDQSYAQRRQDQQQEPRIGAVQQRKKELKKAIEYYQQAAKRGHLDAITDLGFIYEKGLKIRLDINISDETYNRSTFTYLGSGHNKEADHQLNLKDKIEQPIGGKFDQNQKNQTNKKITQQEKKQNIEKFFIEPEINHAIKYYLIARNKNFPRALNNLGALLIQKNDEIAEKEKGQNLRKGLKYLLQASQLNYPRSFYNLGLYYRTCVGDTKLKNVCLAKKYFYQGSQLGDIPCKVQYIKSLILQAASGPQYEQNLIQVVELMRQVLFLMPRNFQILYLMGSFYQKGLGVEKNSKTAYYYISQAASGGYGPALTKIGDYYYSGFQCDKDFDKAQFYYLKATQIGQDQAKLNLKILMGQKLELQGNTKQTKSKQTQQINRTNNYYFSRNDETLLRNKGGQENKGKRQEVQVRNMPRNNIQLENKLTEGLKNFRGYIDNPLVSDLRETVPLYCIQNILQIHRNNKNPQGISQPGAKNTLTRQQLSSDKQKLYNKGNNCFLTNKEYQIASKSPQLNSIRQLSSLRALSHRTFKQTTKNDLTVKYGQYSPRNQFERSFRLHNKTLVPNYRSKNNLYYNRDPKHTNFGLRQNKKSVQKYQKYN